jgi:hypothetical protein
MAESDQKHFQLWGQRPNEAQEIPKETEHSLLEWAGWPRKKLPKQQIIEETSLEQAILDRRDDAHPAAPQAAPVAPPAAVPAPPAPLAPAAPAPDAPGAPKQA